MRNGKYQNKKSGFNVRPLALLLAVVLLVGVSVGGTLAWLTDKSKTVTNTFTDSDINITLTETEREYKMIPGWTIDKDPVVTVEAGSEDCWLFVKIEETGASYVPDGDTMPVVYAVGDFIDYDVITGQQSDALVSDTYWMPVQGNTGVYACKVKAVPETDTDGVSFPVIWYDIDGDQTMDDAEISKVGVKETVTKEMMDNISGEGATKPTLTFTAYAVQLYKSNGVEFEVGEAWKNAQNLG